MNDVENNTAYVRKVDGIQPVSLQMDQPLTISNNGTVPVQVYIDLPNIESSLKSRDRFGTDYGDFVRAVLCRFAERLGLKVANRDGMTRAINNGMPHDKPVVLCRAVWCVTSRPVNFHPSDTDRVRKRQGFLTALRRRHHFVVEEVPQDFRGNYLSYEDSFETNITKEQAWHPKEKGVDVLLAIRLIKRCSSPDRPAGVILMAGDADYAPALNEVLRQDPPIVVMVAAFSDSLSEVYFSGGPLGYSWQYPPILLDDCLVDLQSEPEGLSVRSGCSTEASKI